MKKVKKCKRCHENMQLQYGTCPRCGYWHGAPECNIFKEEFLNENKGKTKKESDQEGGWFLGHNRSIQKRKKPL